MLSNMMAVRIDDANYQREPRAETSQIRSRIDKSICDLLIILRSREQLIIYLPPLSTVLALGAIRVSLCTISRRTGDVRPVGRDFHIDMMVIQLIPSFQRLERDECQPIPTLSIVLEWTPLGRTLRVRLLLDDFPCQLHQLLPELLIL